MKYDKKHFCILMTDCLSSWRVELGVWSHNFRFIRATSCLRVFIPEVTALVAKLMVASAKSAHTSSQYNV